MSLNDYEWGYCRRCAMLVATITLLGKADTVLDQHGGRTIGGECPGSFSRPQENPGRSAGHAFADPSLLPTIPCEVY